MFHITIKDIIETPETREKAGYARSSILLDGILNERMESSQCRNPLVTTREDVVEMHITIAIMMRITQIYYFHKLL